MRKMLMNTLYVSALLAASTCALAQSSGQTHASQAIKEGAESSGHASASAAHGIAASGQATLGLSAVPLSIGGAVLGSVGGVSTAAANESMNAASAPIGTPLKITDEVISVTPPNEALKK
jgi:hypothetical protein